MKTVVSDQWLVVGTETVPVNLYRPRYPLG